MYIIVGYTSTLYTYYIR